MGGWSGWWFGIGDLIVLCYYDHIWSASELGLWISYNGWCREPIVSGKESRRGLFLITSLASPVSPSLQHIFPHFPRSRHSQTRGGGSGGGSITFICWTKLSQCTMTLLWITRYNFPSALLPQGYCDNILTFSRSRDYRLGQCSGSTSAPTLSTFSSSSITTLSPAFSWTISRFLRLLVVLGSKSPIRRPQTTWWHPEPH